MHFEQLIEKIQGLEFGDVIKQDMVGVDFSVFIRALRARMNAIEGYFSVSCENDVLQIVRQRRQQN